MRAIDVLCAICAAVDKGDDPELILAEDSPLMEDARELLKPKAPPAPPMLSHMDDLVDERDYLRKKVVSLEESIERTFDDMAVLRQENAELQAAQLMIYDAGYSRGHNDTEEGHYAPPIDYPEEFPELLADILSDIPAPPAQGEQ